MRRLVAAVAIVLVSLLTLTACGGGSSSSSATDPSGQDTKKISITFTGSDTDPSGTVIDVAVGQPIEFDVKADKPGEIHVHSTPEQEFEYKSGTSTFQVKPIQAPGDVTVESHTLDKVLFKLRAQ